MLAMSLRGLYLVQFWTSAINVFISDLHKETECIISKFSDGAKLGGGVDTPEAVLPFEDT